MQPVEVYSETSEDYASTPPVLDYPVQALNPSLQRPNPLVFLELTTATSSLGKLVFQLFENEVPRTAHNFLTLCCGDPLKVSTTSELPRHIVLKSYERSTWNVCSGMLPGAFHVVLSTLNPTLTCFAISTYCLRSVITACVCTTGVFKKHRAS